MNNLLAPYAISSQLKIPEVDIAVIVPVYKGETFFGELVSRLEHSLSSCCDSFRIILVDDESPDQSWKLIESEASKNANLVGIKLSRNFGQHAAISAGFSIARAKWYVVMDCDLQDPPEQIPTLHKEALEHKVDIVRARRESSGLGLGRNIGSALFNSILRWISGLDVSSEYGNFRIISEKVANAYRAYPEQLRFFPAIMSQVGFRQIDIPLPRHERSSGGSSYSPIKLAKLALENMISYSEKPLWYGVGVGAVISAVSVAYGCVVLISALIQQSVVPGFPTLATLISVLGGVQIMLISLTGLYVGRVLNEARQRPIFIIDQMISSG
ncbi:MAG: glycosyltransferase family 2 protein [Pseudomonadota bacterium]